MHLSDPNVRVVAQVAPAVRVAVGDHYGQPKGRSVMGKKSSMRFTEWALMKFMIQPSARILPLWKKAQSF